MNDAKERKMLIRPQQGRMVAGVCAGLGDYFGADPNVIRVIFAALTLFSLGAAALVYLVGWVVIPEEGEERSIADNLLNKDRTK